MKRTQVIELFANIKKTFVSFFSIMLFVAIGMDVFLGLNWAPTALHNAAQSHYDEGSLHSFQLQYIYGMTDDELAKLMEVDGVTNVEAVRQSFQTLSGVGNGSLTTKVQTLPKSINTLTVREGELPAKSNEIALNSAAAERLGLHVGDTITFDKDADQEGQMGDAKVNGSASASGEQVDGDGMKYLTCSTFTVTALVDSPEFLVKASNTYGFSSSASGATDLLAWVPADAFDASAYGDGYPVVNIACDSLKGLNTFTDEYKSKSKAIEDRLTEAASSLAEERFAKLKGDAEEKLNDAERQLSEGKQKIADGEAQLADARSQLETKSAEGEAALAQAHSKLRDYESLKQQGAAALADARAMIAEAQDAMAEADAVKADVQGIAADANAYKAQVDAQLKSGEITQEEYDAALDAYGATLTERLQYYGSMLGVQIPAITHANYGEAAATVEAIAANFDSIPVEYAGETLTLGEARAKLAEGKQLLAAGEAEYSDKAALLDSGWSQYYAAQDTLKQAVSEGEQKLADAEAKLAEAKAQVAENEPKLEEAKQALADMKNGTCSVLPRSVNAGVAQVSTLGGIMTNVSYSMAALFVIVGLLVSYAAVSRLVHEQTSQIGMKKALGLRSSEITLSFLLYSGFAVAVGAVIGALMGVFVVQGIVGRVLGDMFVFGAYPPYFGWGLFLIVTLLEMVLILGATWIACRGILKQHAIDLLRGPKPPGAKTRFYEKWGIWAKLPLLTQTIVNNCVYDKRRVFNTVVGVAGCTALIVTAFTLNNNVL
nr:FtsX-like permease family protein [Eggerthellaceae bacterium]